MAEMIVTTSSGKIRGYERNGGIEFLGIPYAEPPVGELRLKRARPVRPWEGIFDAKEYGHPSVQFENGTYKGDEDCLTLNVQRPKEGANLPVMVWIHGGGYNTGCASDPLYNGKAFVEDGIVFFSIQYRLNVFGFYDFTTYPGCEGFDSNCGVSDQVLALQWIHENAEAFGGNPNQITIAGESAGATAVATMMAVPTARGLFQQAIVQSAIPNAIFTHEAARRDMDLFIEGMGWEEKDLQKLRTIEPFAPQKGNTFIAENSQDRYPGIYLPSPVLDDLMPVRPIEAIRNGSAKDVKLMIGTNMHEATMFVRPQGTVFPNSWQMVKEMFAQNGYGEKFDAVFHYYQKQAGTETNGIPDEVIQLATDYAFQEPALHMAEAQKGHGEVWMYRYEFVSRFGAHSGMKASHAFELPCVFKNEEFEFSREIFQEEPEANKKRMMEEVHAAWSRFIKYGHPDEENWPQYTGYNSLVRIFDVPMRTEYLEREELVRIWDQMHFYET